MSNLHPTACALSALSAVRKARGLVRVHAHGVREFEDQRAAFYGSIWTDAAHASGAEVLDLGGSLIEMRVSGSRMRVRNHVTSLDDPVTLNLAGDKHLVLSLLRREGIPTPRHLLCGATELTTAWRFLRGLSRACVVKPARGTAGGSGVTTGVAGRLQLASALATAGAFCSDAVIEEQVAGEDYRLLYLDGNLLDAVKRSAPTVCGDGRATLKELVARENRVRTERGIAGSQRLILPDGELRRTLADQGRSLHTVPKAGERVRLKRVVGDNRGEDNESAGDRLCDEIINAGARAANALGVRLAGVDIICSDPGVPLEESGGVVIEVNTTPSLYYHYVKRPGPTDVARMILTRLAAGDEGDGGA